MYQFNSIQFGSFVSPLRASRTGTPISEFCSLVSQVNSCLHRMYLTVDVCSYIDHYTYQCNQQHMIARLTPCWSVPQQIGPTPIPFACCPGRDGLKYSLQSMNQPIMQNHDMIYVSLQDVCTVRSFPDLITFDILSSSILNKAAVLSW